jgi:hypothetical protein
MKAFLFFAMGAALCADGCADTYADGPTAAAPLSCPGKTWFSYPPDGLQYASTVGKQQLAASPDWEENDPNPPLSARRALALAEAAASRILKNGGDKDLERLCDAAKLMPLGGKKWCWDVRYEWRPRRGAWDGPPYHFDVFILMDGSVVEPVARQQDTRSR